MESIYTNKVLKSTNSINSTDGTDENSLLRERVLELNQNAPSSALLKNACSISQSKIGVVGPSIAALFFLVAGSTMAACNTEHIGNCEAGMVFTPLAGAVASLFAGLYFSASERPDKLALGGFFLSAPGFFIAAMLLTQCSSENSVYCGVGSTLSPFMGMLAFTSLAVAMSDRMSGS